VGSPLITQRHKAKLNAPSEICPMTQGCEPAGDSFANEFCAPLGSSDNLEERDFCGVAINSETWETLNPDKTKKHFEFELTRKNGK
jgi:hypothetical protein